MGVLSSLKPADSLRQNFTSVLAPFSGVTSMLPASVTAGAKQALEVAEDHPKLLGTGVALLGLGLTPAAKQLLHFAEDHPYLSAAIGTAVGIAFPPVRAAISAGALQVAGKVSSLLRKHDLDSALAGWKQASGQGLSIMERADQALLNTEKSEQRQREDHS